MISWTLNNSWLKKWSRKCTYWIKNYPKMTIHMQTNKNQQHKTFEMNQNRKCTSAKQRLYLCLQIKPNMSVYHHGHQYLYYFICTKIKTRTFNSRGSVESSTAGKFFRPLLLVNTFSTKLTSIIKHHLRTGLHLCEEHIKKRESRN